VRLFGGAARTVVAIATAAVAIACGEPAPAPAAARPWNELRAEERDARLFAELDTAPRRILVGRSLLRFVDVGPRRTPDTAGARSAAPPWLFVHGFGGSVGDFAPLVIRLSESRRVLALDLPGFGESVTEEDDTSIEFLADLVEQFAAAVGAPRANLVCHSLGGQVCLALAIRRSTAVATLTLIDAAGVYAKSSFVEGMTKTFAHVNVGDVVTARGRSALDVPEGDRAIFERLVSDDRATLTALESFRADYRGEVPRIAAPTRVIWGSEDPLFSLDSAFFLAGNIDGARLYLVEGAGHVPQLTHPEIVLRWLLDLAAAQEPALGGTDAGT
jgi:pyruvate dehydrogenase E2 component (dihydrolipoamide acetyltransferase)